MKPNVSIESYSSKKKAITDKEMKEDIITLFKHLNLKTNLLEKLDMQLFDQSSIKIDNHIREPHENFLQDTQSLD